MRKLPYKICNTVTIRKSGHVYISKNMLDIAHPCCEIEYNDEGHVVLRPTNALNNYRITNERDGWVINLGNLLELLEFPRPFATFYTDAIASENGITFNIYGEAPNDKFIQTN